MWNPEPRRKDAWPSDMRITVDEHAQHLKILLFLRQAWSLAQDLNIPELSPMPEIGNSRIPESASREVWNKRWKQEWKRSWAWYDIESVQHAPITQDELQVISRPRQELNPLVPPFWPVEYGKDGLDWPAFNSWDIQSIPGFPSRAESESTPALVAAWKAGLTSLIVLPYHGFFAHRLNDVTWLFQRKQDVARNSMTGH